VSSARLPIEREALQALLDRRFGPIANRWGVREVIQYALASGADQQCIEYVYEGYGPHILPTFAIFAAGPWTSAVVGLLPDGANPVYAGFSYTFHEQVQLEGELSSIGEVVCIDFRDTSALVWLRVQSYAAARVIVSCLCPLYVAVKRGESETLGVRLDNTAPPLDGDPLEPTSVTVDARATILYHLLLPVLPSKGSSDGFHVDRAEAHRRGFKDTPLHGAGITGHLGLLLANTARQHGTGRIVELGGRFAGPVFPGDTLVLRLWRPTMAGERWPLVVENGRGEAVIAKAWVRFSGA
jgi:hypothetical protein